MDSVQKFITENQHQLGYIMSEASRRWIENDQIGAFTVGECNLIVKKNGQYHEVLESRRKYKVFYDYFSELYGMNLGVSNWHKNREEEPFDVFFNDAEDKMQE